MDYTDKRDDWHDEYPELISEEWEVAMDRLGHNVTSHIREDGECNRCDQLEKYGLTK